MEDNNNKIFEELIEAELAGDDRAMAVAEEVTDSGRGILVTLGVMAFAAGVAAAVVLYKKRHKKEEVESEEE